MPRYVRPAHDEFVEAAIDAFGNRARVAVLSYVRRQGPCTRGEIAAALSIAPPTTSNHLAALEAAGLISLFRRRHEIRRRVASGCDIQSCQSVLPSSTELSGANWARTRIKRELAACRAILNGFNDKLCPMAVAKGSKIRRDHTPTVLFQTRVDPAIRAEVNLAAAASGVSTGIYLEALLRRTLEDLGKLPVLDLIRDQKEELLIPAA
jgi:DNA-binding transcriptional ArsR family regulator